MRKSYVRSLTDLSDAALRCHAWGHPWDAGPVSLLSPVGLEVWSVTLTCPSCGKTRRDHLEPGTYELENRRYTDPDGYKLVEPVAQPGYREEWVRRRTEKQAGKDRRKRSTASKKQT